MTRSLIQSACIALFSLTTSLVVCAQEFPDRIRGYFPGRWESTGGPDGNGTVEWKLVSGGKTVAGPGFTDNNGATFGMGGWKSKERVWLHTWFEENGGYGMTELTKFENGTYSGKTRTVSGDGEITTGDFQIIIKDDNHFTLKVTEGGQAVTSEWTRSEEEASLAYSYLKDLDVFTGTWEGTTVLSEEASDSDKLGDIGGKSVTVIETCSWAPGKAAQVSEVAFTIEGTETIRGTMLIGWDQNKEKITVRGYTTHRGVWSGTAEKDGNTWIFSLEGYNLDGKKSTFKRIVTFTDKDHYTVIEQEQTLDGKAEPDQTWQFKRR